MTEKAAQSPAEMAAAGKQRGPYDSEQMTERRLRMIDVTKAMIAESGAESFTIRELTRRAKVSVTVVYSAYGDKEGLIAAAIQDFYEKLDLTHRPAARTLNRVLGDIDEAAAVILANPSYSRSVAALYFSPTVDSRVYAIVRNIAVRTFLPWLENAMAHGEAVPALPIETMCATLANDRWAVIFDWARGRIPDARLAEAMKTSFLISATGLAIGETREKLEAALAKLLPDVIPMPPI
jgi:AcrR family transcriptional regulator